MNRNRSHYAVFVTVPDRQAGRKIARAALAARAAACVNILPKVESHYWWKGSLHVGSELLLLFKTHANRLADLERVVHDLHPYDTPEFVAILLSAGSERYFDWIDESVSGVPARVKRSRQGRRAA